MLDCDHTFIIAEAGVNHNGSFELAKELVLAAAEAGADAIKFQTFSANNLVLKNTKKADYQVKNTGNAMSQYDMLRALEISPEAHFELRNLAHSNGIEFMSSAFDRTWLAFLIEEVGVKRLKIPSGEMLNGPLILLAARSKLPVILSSGMCTIEDVLYTLSIIAWADRYPDGHPSSAEELDNLRARDGWLDGLKERISLLQCVSEYPTAPADLNLKAIATLQDATGLRTGLSDHSVGWHLPVASVAAGASIIEKHFTLSRRLPGPDHIASLEPDELLKMVTEVRDVEAAMGTGEKKLTEKEMSNSLVARGSIVANAPIAAGTPFGPELVAIKRPSTGISPKHFWDLVSGTIAHRDYVENEQIDASELTASLEGNER